MAGPSKTRTYAWRKTLPIHPACEIVPPQSDKALSELGDSIRSNGMQTPIIILTPPNGRPALLDGRSRLDAMEYVGIPFEIRIIEDGGVVVDCSECDVPPANRIVPDIDFNPYAFVLLTNLHRRHLKIEEKRLITRQVMNLFPSLTDRAIARLSGVDKGTVGKLRKEIARVNGDFAISDERTEANGRAARGRRPQRTLPPASPAPLPAAELPPITPVAALPPAPSKTQPKQIDNREQVLAVARCALEVLGRPVSAPNWERARDELRHLINLLLAAKPSKSATAAPAQRAA